MNSVTLLEREWRNSRNETDFWRFEMNDDCVNFTYSALFDADTNEHSHVYAQFSRPGFTECIKMFLKYGFGRLKDDDNSLSFYKSDEGVDIMVSSGSEGFSTTIKELPQIMLNSLGLS